MRIWLVKIGETIPQIGAQLPRLFRTGQFALWASSHAEVQLWASAFDYQRQIFLPQCDYVYGLNKKLRIRLIKGCGYSKSISLRRFLDQNIIARNMLRAMRSSAEKPDIILCCAPPVELAAVAIQYGAEKHVPVLLDLRDMWPDIFIDNVPKGLRGVARVILSPLFQQAKTVFSKADALVGITDEFLEWGLLKAARKRTDWDAVFPFTYNAPEFESSRLTAAQIFLDKIGVTSNNGIFRLCYLGTLTNQTDMSTLISASKLLRKMGRRVQFVIAGDGNKLLDFQNIARGNTDIVFTGWVDAAVLHEIMRRSCAGLDPLLDRYDFLSTINNKAVEYLSAGIPVISSPARGTLFKFLKLNHCGLSYQYGDSKRLATIISALMDNPSELQAMSANAERAFQENFLPDDVNARMLSHLERVVKEFPINANHRK